MSRKLVCFRIFRYCISFLAFKRYNIDLIVSNDIIIENSLKELIEETRGVTLTVGNRLGIARDAFAEKSFSRKEYQNLLKTISTATASRDLHRGVKLGYLKRTGDKRTSVYRFKTIKSKR